MSYEGNPAAHYAALAAQRSNNFLVSCSGQEWGLECYILIALVVVGIVTLLLILKNFLFPPAPLQPSSTVVVMASPAAPAAPAAATEGMTCFGRNKFGEPVCRI